MKRIGKLFIPLLKIRGDMVRHVIDDGEFLIQHQAVLDAIVEEDADLAEAAMKVLLSHAIQASTDARKQGVRK
jgi:DNA-binding GntR family transcriptional regulator